MLMKTQPLAEGGQIPLATSGRQNVDKRAGSMAMRWLANETKIMMRNGGISRNNDENKGAFFPFPEYPGMSIKNKLLIHLKRQCL
jgi:hypothetical protein